jgi:hypothetical protein
LEENQAGGSWKYSACIFFFFFRWLFTFFLDTGAIERSADLFCLRRWMQLTADE